MHKIELLKSLHELKIPVAPVELENSRYMNRANDKELRSIKATVIGNLFFPQELPEIIIEQVQLMSHAFSLPYISAVFVSDDGLNYSVAEVSTVPNITESMHRDAILKYLS